MISIIFLPIIAIELAVVIWILLCILEEIEDLKHHKHRCNPPPDLINPF